MADADDAHHDRCRDALDVATGPLVVPDLVVAEVAYLIGTRLGAKAEVKFIASLAAGELIVEHVSAGDWLRIADLVATYRDLPLGTVDAAIVALGERLDVKTLITLDARHFRVVRPAHTEAFNLLP
ncbi:MAG TPA: PIN domain-containing protein [Candidatus Limnocylindria bacterium]|nr:PIN domain-containing protein [Candidatus Limnocylindria bacterium]